MLSTRINKWIDKLRKRQYFYRDGFFEFPFLGNSPDVMIKSIAASILNKHIEEEHLVKIKSPFADGDIRYQEIESGLWLILFDVNWKANFRHYKIIDSEIKTDFYVAGYGIYKRKFPSPFPIVNKLSYTHKSWIIIKPGQSHEAVYYKGTKGTFFNLYFTKQWLEKNVLNKNESSNSSLFEFLQSDRNYVVWPELVDTSETAAEALYNTLLNRKKGNEWPSLLKQQAIDLLKNLVNKLHTEKAQENYSELHGDDKKKILRAEKFLIDNLFKEFPGIEGVSQNVGMSPTKLKNCFKTYYGATLFDYYQEKRFYFAREVLITGELKVKDVAAMLGYENSSKFTAAFKKQFDMLPSELLSS